MILPIRAYGDPILRKKTEEITEDYKNLDAIIKNMFDTMQEASGIGLAAPQVGLNIRIFIVDLSPMTDNENYEAIKDELAVFQKVFINPKIIKEEGEEWKFAEGCLSIPQIHEDISRLDTVTIEYFDEKWTKHKEIFSDIRARVIQHEYDHLEGKMFVDYLSPLKKKLINGKLRNITKGNIKTDYQMKFPL